MLAGMGHETIVVAIEDAVATITLNRPERLNAYTAQMGVEIFTAIHDLDRDDRVRAIVITGAGRAFCAGADLAAGGATFAGERTWNDANAIERKVRPWNLCTPVIVAFNGPAVGVGATLPLQWDIRIASDRAKIGFVFTRRGIIPEANSTWYLPRLVGFARAAELLMTGRVLTAAEALEYGVVSRVVPHDDLPRVAREMARDIAENTAPVSVAITKRLLWRQMLSDEPWNAKRFEDELFHWIGKQPDAAEGVTAFLEKRAPRWSMSKTADVPASLGEIDEG
jgi:enoyl-CoA hydratase/carnithine racemase